MFKFSTLSIISASVAFALFIFLLAFPMPIYRLFGVEDNASAYFFTRRAAFLFLGFALIAFFSRNAEHSQSRQAICLGIGSSMLTLCLLGAVEYFRGFAGTGVFVAMIGELGLAIGYFYTYLMHRNQNSNKIGYTD